MISEEHIQREWYNLAAILHFPSCCIITSSPPGHGIAAKQRNAATSSQPVSALGQRGVQLKNPELCWMDRQTPASEGTWVRPHEICYKYGHCSLYIYLLSSSLSFAPVSLLLKWMALHTAVPATAEHWQPSSLCSVWYIWETSQHTGCVFKKHMRKASPIWSLVMSIRVKDSNTWSSCLHYSAWW